MMENKCFEKIAFAFFDFCADHRLASFASIFATVVALAGIASAMCQSGSAPLIAVSAVFGIATGVTAHIGFGVWFVTSDSSSR